MTATVATVAPVATCTAHPARRDHRLPTSLHRMTSGRGLAVAAGVLAAWCVVQSTTSDASTWRVVTDLVVFTGLHGLAVLAVFGDRAPDSPGTAVRTTLGIGLGALTVATVLTRTADLLPVGLHHGLVAGLHVCGLIGIVVLLLSLVLRLRGRLVLAGLGLDAVSTALGLTTVAGTVVLAALAGGGVDPTTRVILLITLVDVALVSAAVALCSVLRPGRTSMVPALLLGTVLMLAADLQAGYAVHSGLSGVTDLGRACTVAGCLAIAAAVNRPVGTAAGAPLVAADRLGIWSNVLPFAGAGANLLAVLIVERVPHTHQWGLPLVLAAAGCLAVVAVRLLITIRVARSALEQLQDALTDQLTGLLNRRGLAAQLDRWLAGPEPVTLLALDLDEFRRINEEAGHETGDWVLQRVADQLTHLAGGDAVVARIDGDDFALAFAGDDPGRAATLAAVVRDTLGRPFDLDRHRLHLSVNVGTAVSHALPGTGHEVRSARPAALLRCADQALAQAQSSTSGTAVHDPGGCGQTREDSLLAWVDDLHGALAADDQLLLHFQPQHRIEETGTGTTATVVGCEALLRWAHPTRGLLGPGEVLRAAEHGHLAAAVTERVLDLALAAAAGWWFDREVPVAVNLSATDLDDVLLPHRIVAALDRHGLPARVLTVELVEDTLMLDPDRAVQNLTALRSIGLRIAVDDYGTGYSSLAYLHRLPIDEVKFDRSLTAGISTDPAAASIIGHSIRLAHDLGLSALAEGIEERADLDLLFQLGCDAVQGWLTGHPLPAAGWMTSLDLGSTTPRP